MTLQTYNAYITGGRSQGKLTMNIAMAKMYIRQGKKVVFATIDQQLTINMLMLHFPKGTLFATVGDWGVTIHER